MTLTTRPIYFDQFASAHGLNLIVKYRQTLPKGADERSRFYAAFDRAEVKHGGMLKGEYGDGPTPEEATKAYAQALRGQLLVIDAYKSSRREIRCPSEWEFVSE